MPLHLILVVTVFYVHVGIWHVQSYARSIKTYGEMSWGFLIADWFDLMPTIVSFANNPYEHAPAYYHLYVEAY